MLKYVLYVNICKISKNLIYTVEVKKMAIETKDQKTINQIKELNELESNLKHAIDDLILESDVESTLVSQHVSMIVTQLAMAAANLRIQKQQKRKQIV